MTKRKQNAPQVHKGTKATDDKKPAAKKDNMRLTVNEDKKRKK